MLIKSVALISVLAVFAQSAPANVKVVPFVESSLPVKFREVIAEAAPKVPSNLDSYQYGLDFAGLVSFSSLECVQPNGYAVIFASVYDPAGQGSFDPNSCYTIQNAYQAGLGVEIYMPPQPYSKKQGYQQLDEIYQGLDGCGITIRSVWIQVSTFTLDWMNPIDNIYFIKSIVSRARQYGMTVGIYTNKADWNQITRGWTDIGSDVLLWYHSWYGPGINGKTPANFDDFRPFGGWSTPSVKQFDAVEHLCGINMNQDVFLPGTMLKSSDAVEEDGKIYAGGFIRGNK